MSFNYLHWLDNSCNIYCHSWPVKSLERIEFCTFCICFGDVFEFTGKYFKHFLQILEVSVILSLSSYDGALESCSLFGFACGSLCVAIQAPKMQISTFPSNIDRVNVGLKAAKVNHCNHKLNRICLSRLYCSSNIFFL